MRQLTRQSHGLACAGLPTVADPKAIQHILHASGYRFPKAAISQRNAEELFGHGILAAKGATHARHRKIMNPAFSHGQLKTFSRLFQLLAGNLTEKMVEIVGKSGYEAPINLHMWLGRMTLDAVGRAGFGYDFGAIQDVDNELANILNNIFVDSIKPGVLTHVGNWMWERVPSFLRSFIEFFPTKKTLRFKHFQDRSKVAAKDILEGAKDQTDFMSGKDIISVLVRANASENSAKQLSEDEVLSQASTMILAGHETSASTLSWLFHELSNHPDIQSAVRDEINEVRSRYPNKGEIPTHEYENMAYLNAVVNETLRMHPIVPILFRKAAQDDIIPLAEPVVTSTGVLTKEIPVLKGQHVHIAIHAYNRNTSVWGEDADIWRAERWLEARKNDNGITVGVFNNILSFSAGIRSCIGWRFAYVPYSRPGSTTIAFELVENFRFEAAKDLTVKRQPAGSAMMPMVRGRMHEGMQMPLKVTPL
ncbi:cytochrome P450 [Cylindrobasidium torrendii FP15055 ss-10]|uniref:Cytochrome P450 n=1 Tax=Cylindrobasidium torrendii FP15055 ss-10 TaxID=1314674 RepID=A0A0D7AXJ4_9AGAR|nr:cytochrome P450 [Cylindrobasidium torrendii FP15055 ss-10]